MLAITMAAFTFTSCEDVPEPYQIPGGGNNGGTTVEEVSGDGTQANPFNALGAIEYISKMEAGVESAEDIYVKGIVVSIKENFTTQYGNAAFYIADTEAGTKFYVFRALYLGNKKYTTGDLLKEGDEVIVCGKVVNYMGNTPETVQNKAYIYSLNGKTSSEGGEQPPVGELKGDGTQTNPFNPAAANDYISKLPADQESENDIFIKGKVSSIDEQFGTQYGNATFNISEDGTTGATQFKVFRALYEGNVKFTGGDLIAIGDDVVICGKVVNYYGNTPETAQGKAYIFSWTKNGGSTGGDDNPGGEVTENSITVTAKSFGLENGTVVPTQTLADGTVLTFDGGGNTNVPKYYNTGSNIRMYPKNSVKITSSSRKIASVIFNCDEYNGQIYNASGDLSAAQGAVKAAEKVVTISDVNSTETLITNVSTTTGAPSQLRIVSITINYAK